MSFWAIYINTCILIHVSLTLWPENQYGSSTSCSKSVYKVKSLHTNLLCTVHVLPMACPFCNVLTTLVERDDWGGGGELPSLEKFGNQPWVRALLEGPVDHAKPPRLNWISAFYDYQEYINVHTIQMLTWFILISYSCYLSFSI